MVALYIFYEGLGLYRAAIQIDRQKKHFFSWEKEFTMSKSTPAEKILHEKMNLPSILPLHAKNMYGHFVKAKTVTQIYQCKCF